MISEILALLLGIIAGTLTGLIPGIHINQVSAITLSLFPFLPFSPIVLAIFIASMSITETFTDFLPSVFLGSPEEDSALSVLPGHKMLLQGKGYEAVLITVYGSLAGVIIIIFFTPLFILFLPKVYPFVQNYMFYVLILVSLILMFKEKNKILATSIFLLAGILGVLSMNLEIKNSLIPLLTGLFGASGLTVSLIQKTKLKKQIISRPKIKFKEIIKSILPSFIASPLVSFLPALGSSQAAIISLSLKKEQSQRQFLILLGSINTIVMGLSFVALYSINKARTGSAVTVSSLLGNFSLAQLILILLAGIIAAFFAAYITMFFAKVFSKNIIKINYQLISLVVLIFISIITFLFSGFLGFIVYLIATCLGIFCILSNIRRTHLMGSLMVPAILFYLPLG